MLRIVLPVAALLLAPAVVKFVKDRLDDLVKRHSDHSNGCSGRCCDRETGRPIVSKEKLDSVDRRIDKIEMGLSELKELLERQTKLVARLVQNISIKDSIRSQESASGEETRSDADYVDLASGKGSRASPYEFVSWAPHQVVAWVERVVGNDSQNACFENVDGHVLSGMVFEHDHGLSFADKCFFLGVDRESSVLLERGILDLIK